jgi:hypothetical protein
MHYRKFVLFVLAAFGLNCQFGGAQNPRVPESLYKELRSFSLDMLHELPPESHYFLGLGRGLSLPMAFLQLTVPDSASTFPFSVPGDLEEGLSLRGRRYSPDTHRRLVEPYFRSFLPSRERLGARKLLVLDDASAGESLHFFLEALFDYYRNSGETNLPVIQALPIPVGSFRAENKAAIEELTGLPLLEYSARAFSQLALALCNGSYKPFGQYLNPGEAPPGSFPLVPQPGFIALQKELGKYILKPDSVLDALLVNACRSQIEALGK